MPQRAALLVGSMPFADEEACMTEALDALGMHLFALPDGEIGDKSPLFPKGNRIAWVMYAIEMLTADQESWQIVKPAVRGADGLAVNYQGIQKLKPRHSPAAMPQHVSLGYDGFFRRSYPRFKQLAAERGLAHLKFQMGIPTGFAMGFAFASALDWLRYTNAFNTVLAREVNRMLEDAGDDLLVQIELPAEVYAASMLPGPLMGLSLRPLYDLLGKIRPATQIGIHLCLGDFHNEAIVHPKTLDKLVAFSNRMVGGWPSAQRLVYVHYPLAEGAIAPRTDAAYYRPLRDIRLPAQSHFVAGFVHEGLSLEENKRLLDTIEQARGQTVAIASSCGLGRRSPDDARRVLELTRQLAAL